MTSDVVLTAALRNNLLSLQQTQSSIDTTQFRLATGRKVNSALDNPQNFFASQALQNRASDLNRLLDGIGQNIQVIKAADAGVTALTQLVEQADSVAQNARDALAGGQSEAKVVGDVNLTGVNDLTTINGITNTDTIVLSLTDEDGQTLGIGAFGAAGITSATATITINTNDSIDQLITEINDLQFDDGNGDATGGQAFEASLDDSGNLQIRTLNGGDFRADFVSTADTDAANLALSSALGYGTIASLESDGAGTNEVSFSAIADPALTSFEFFRTVAGNQEVALRSTTLDNLVDDSGVTNYFANIATGDADTYTISINGGTTVSLALDNGSGVVTIQEFIDSINDNDSLNEFIQADFVDATGQVTIRAVNAEVQSIEIGASSTTSVTANFGFGVVGNITAGAGAANAIGESIQLGAAAAELASLENEFDNLRDQITQLVTNGDTGYRGTNLLFGDNLTTFFNEDRSSSLVTGGVSFTADGLGLTEANFSRTSSVDGALSNVRDALLSVREFGSTLANDLSIIQTREDFTKSLINTLTEGSDKLTIADQNEEGAKLLALQTRQQLGVTSLSLASQSQQSILRLF